MDGWNGRWDPSLFSLFSVQSACAIRVPMEIVKQRSQVNQNLSLLHILRSSYRAEVNISSPLSPLVRQLIHSSRKGFRRSLSRLLGHVVARDPLRHHPVPAVGIFQGDRSLPFPSVVAFVRDE